MTLGEEDTAGGQDAMDGMGGVRKQLQGFRWVEVEGMHHDSYRWARGHMVLPTGWSRLRSDGGNGIQGVYQLRSWSVARRLYLQQLRALRMFEDTGTVIGSLTRCNHGSQYEPYPTSYR